MKKLLVVFWLFSISLKAQANEQRLVAFHPSNNSFSWDQTNDRFPGVLEHVERKGVLTQTRVRAIDSIHPYDTEAGRTVSRPFQIDDLMYESLMLADPVSPSEARYPLIAQALRVPDDMSYVIFEIDRLTQLGRARLSLIIDPSYWGRGLSTRQGFFNFRAVEIITYADETAARQSMVNETANFLFESQPGAAAATLALLKQKNQNIKHVEQDTDNYGKRLPVLSFNIQNPAVKDWRVRQAILLAYDFEFINYAHYAGTLQRPLSLLQDGPLSPKGEPGPNVKALMDQCSAPSGGAFESHGHAQYAQITDKRIRLLTAMRLFQEAGLKVGNGTLKRPTGDGNFTPVQLRLLVRDTELRSAYMFRSDLSRLGVSVQVSSAEGDAFRVMRQTREFDLVSGFEGFLDKEGYPRVDRFESRAASQVPCLKEMLSILEGTDPESESYGEIAEALVRVHQALHLSIFTGSPLKKNFFFDARLNLPGTDSRPEKMHLYGYWLDPQPPGVPFHGYYLPNYGHFGGCYDIGCLFGGMR